MDLESILSSTCRRRIINFLAENGSTNIMRLVVGVNGKYPHVNSEVLILQKEEIISERRVGRMRILALNNANQKTMRILQALKLLEN